MGRCEKYGSGIRHGLGGGGKGLLSGRLSSWLVGVMWAGVGTSNRLQEAVSAGAGLGHT